MKTKNNKMEETLEEAAINNYKELYEGEPLIQDVPIDAFKQGAKWQQEQDLSMVQGYLSANLKNIELLKRSYSEEEVYDLIHKRDIFWTRYKNTYSQDYISTKEWFEQFKKK